MNKYKVNLDYQDIIDDIEGKDRFEIDLLTKKVLLTGNAGVVEHFYKEQHKQFRNKYDKVRVGNYFWSNVGPKNARVFFGITKMINDAMVKLVTNGGYDVIVVDGAENELADETKRLNYILEKNDFEDSKWGLCESFASGYGYGTIKVSYDKEIVDVPIAEVIKPELVEVETKRGFRTGYVFKERVKVNTDEYEIREIYFKDKGKVLIKYEVWQIKGEPSMIKFDELDDKLKESLGLFYLDDEIVDSYSKLSNIPVLLHNNTPYNSWFPMSPFGEADTQALETIEDALSEVLSNMIDEIRKGKIKVLISETLLQMTMDGEHKGLNDFKMDYEVIKGDELEGKSLIQIVQGDINAQKYIEATASLIMYACNKAGLHPLTLGITGVESIAASQESQTEREKVSLRTRKEKLKRWRNSLNNIFVSLLQVDDVMNDREIGDYQVKIDFGEFSNPTPENIIDLLGRAITSGLLSIEEAQDKYFDEDKTPEQKKLIYIKTKVEKGIPVTEEERLIYESSKE